MRREEDLRSLDHANNGKLIIWVLVPSNGPDSLDFKCSCRTYRRVGLMLRNLKSDQEVVCYGFASELTGILEKWDAPPLKAHRKGDTQFSAPWSDIGPELYRRCGPGLERKNWGGCFDTVSTRFLRGTRERNTQGRSVNC